MAPAFASNERRRNPNRTRGGTIGHSAFLAVFQPSEPLFLNSRLAIKLPDARHFVLEFEHADGARHFADGGSGIVRPEDAAILVFVVVEADSLAVDFSQCLPVPELRTPGKQRVTEVNFMDQDAFRRPGLRGDFSRGRER